MARNPFYDEPNLFRNEEVGVENDYNDEACSVNQGEKITATQASKKELVTEMESLLLENSQVFEPSA